MSNIKIRAIATLDIIDKKPVQEEIEIPIEIEYDYIPGAAAKLTGPIEKCYPAEDPEIDDLEIFIDKEKLADQIAERLEEELMIAGDEYIDDCNLEDRLERLETA